MIAGRAAIGLVAIREIRTRIRSKAFRVIVAVTALAFVAVPVITHLSHSGPSTAKVAVLRSQPAFATTLARGTSATHQRVSVRGVRGAAAGAALVRRGSVDAFATEGPNGIHVVVKKSLSPDLSTLLSGLSQQRALAHQVRRLGGDPAMVARAVAAARLQVRTLGQQDPQQSQKIAVAVAAGLLMYLILMTIGQMVAQGVVEEKTSRVVELLLATVRPWQLMAGKVAGIGLVGLIQMLVIGICGVIAGLATHVLTISVSAAVGTVLWLIVWYLLGFLMYAIVFAALGALVSRQEEVATVVSPVLMLVVAGYIVGISILPANPSSSVAEVMSLIPVFAPTMMPMRLAMGGVPVWQAVVSVGLVVAMIPALIWLAARIYRNAVLRTGARVSLRAALRSA